MKTTKAILLILISGVLLQSCLINRYQKVHTTWEKAQENTSSFTTPDSILTVTYNLWNSVGLIKVNIQNRTDSTVYINPWYTYEVVQKTDTSYLSYPDQFAITQLNGSTYLNDAELDELLYYGDEIPIPPNGAMVINSACINCYLRLDYATNDPTGEKDAISYSRENTPFLYERKIGYAFPSDTNLRIVRHIGYVNQIDRYRLVWNISEIPAAQKEQKAFYVHSQRPSVITWIGMVGLGVLYVISNTSEEEE